MTPSDILARENAQLRSKVGELVDIVALLRRETRLQADDAETALLQVRLGVTCHQAQMLFAMHRAHPRPVSSGLISELLHGDLERSLDTIKVQVCRIRQNIGAEAITTVHSRGYQLSDAGLAKVRHALGIAA